MNYAPIEHRPQPQGSMDGLDHRMVSTVVSNKDRLRDLELAAFHEMECERFGSKPSISIVIPVFNEQNTVAQVICAVNALPISKQIIVVDDGSNDGTSNAIEAIKLTVRFDHIRHPTNSGKGAALRSGFEMARGDIVIVQDADLEYLPSDILRVIEPIQRGEAKAVYGSRYLERDERSDSRIHRIGNKLLTLFSNFASGQKLTDMETCYKAFRRDLIQSIRIEQNRFGFEPEITAKLSKLGVRIQEVPINYEPRSWSDGKKIGPKDLMNALWCIVRYRFCR